MITDSTRVRHFSAGPSTSIHRQLTRAIKLSAMRYVPGFTVDLIPARDRPNRGGDHMAFDARGYAAARLTEANEHYTGAATTGRQHNELDVVADIDPAYLARVAKVNLAGVASLALAPEAPGRPTVVTLSPSSIQIAWPSTNSALDLAGYRVAFRDTAADSVFYFEIRDVGVTAGAEQVRLIDGIEHALPIFVSVSAYDSSFNESVFSEEVLVVPPVTAVAGPRVEPTARLHAAEPNPARRETRFRFDLDHPGSVTLEVYDVHGRRVQRVASGRYSAGTWSAVWNSLDLRGAWTPAGVYLVRLSMDGIAVATRRFVRIE